MENDEEWKLLENDHGDFAPRKRTLIRNRTPGVGALTGDDATNIDVPLPELDFNDPNFLELLREYDNDDWADGGEDRIKKLDAMRRRARIKPALGQSGVYFTVICFVMLFVIVVNWYNAKQLERLKEEYGLDDKKSLPEFWWKKSVIYNIYVPSFQDSNGDGFGDINGIRQHLDHLSYLGIDAVLLSGFLDSPFEDFGRDVRDFKYSSRGGTLDDFDQLVKELHQQNIKVIVEIIPNHTSRQHRWFIESRRREKDNKFNNYYIWSEGRLLANGTRLPPNNWVSRYGGPAWTFDDIRSEFYYHYYHPSMPDLNHRDHHVKEELMEIFGFWLDRGVDAIFVDGVHVIFEADDLQLDELPSDKPDTTLDEYAGQLHLYTEDQSEIHDYLGTWREYLENYSARSGRRIGLLVDVVDDTITDVIKYYYTGADQPISHGLINIHEGCRGRCLHELIDAWLGRIAEDRDPIWMLSSGDRGRATSRKGVLYQSVLNMLMLLLPGGAITYYGDEIGLPQTLIDYNKIDFVARSSADNRMRTSEQSRQPIRWTPGEHAKIKEELYGENIPYADVQTQKSDPGGRSILQSFHRLTRLRKERSFVSGRLQYSIVNDNILSFLRFAKDSAPYLIAANFGNVSSTDDYTLSSGVSYGKVVLAVGGGNRAATSQNGDAGDVIREGGRVNLARLTLAPGEGVVVVLLMDIDFSS